MTRGGEGATRKRGLQVGLGRFGGHILARFLAKVSMPEFPEECWLWTGAINTNGYATFTIRTVSYLAHRVAWEMEHRQPFPADRNGCHTCDVRHCVNPAHVFPGTQKENMHDAMEKGRWDPGALHRQKTHCKHGHPFDAENTYHRPDGQRFRGCKACRSIQSKRSRMAA